MKRSSACDARNVRATGFAGETSIVEVIFLLAGRLLQERIVHVLFHFGGHILRDVFEVAHHGRDGQCLRTVNRRIRRRIFQRLGSDGLVETGQLIDDVDPGTLSAASLSLSSTTAPTTPWTPGRWLATTSERVTIRFVRLPAAWS